MLARSRKHKDRVAELVSEVPAFFERRLRLREHLVRLERTQQLIVAFLRRVRAGQDRVADREARAGADALIGDAVAGGMRYASSNGRRASSAASPVDEMPAASVIVAKSAPCSRSV